jgi:hypothetical protein
MWHLLAKAEQLQYGVKAKLGTAIRAVTELLVMLVPRLGHSLPFWRHTGNETENDTFWLVEE